MKYTITQEALTNVFALLNTLPISVLSTVDAISKNLQSAEEVVEDSEVVSEDKE
jgi:hypothetical protein